MIIISHIFIFCYINHRKIGLNSSPVIVLQYFYSFIFIPIFLFTISVNCDSRSIGFTRISNPIHTVLRTKIIGYTSSPIVYNKVILHVISPNHRIFKISTSRDIGINTSIVNKLKIGIPRSTYPYPSRTANHQKRAVFTPGESTIGKVHFFPTSQIEIQFLSYPFTIQVISYIAFSNRV